MRNVKDNTVNKLLKRKNQFVCGGKENVTTLTLWQHNNSSRVNVRSIQNAPCTEPNAYFLSFRFFVIH